MVPRQRIVPLASARRASAPPAQRSGAAARGSPMAHFIGGRRHRPRHRRAARDLVRPSMHAPEQRFRGGGATFLIGAASETTRRTAEARCRQHRAPSSSPAPVAQISNRHVVTAGQRLAAADVRASGAKAAAAVGGGAAGLDRHPAAQARSRRRTPRRSSRRRSRSRRPPARGSARRRFHSAAERATIAPARMQACSSEAQPMG